MKQFKDFVEGYEDHHKFPEYMQKILKKHEQSPEEKAHWAKKAAEARANAKPVNRKADPYKPLGGRDEKSGRSYSEANDMCNVCGQTPCNCTHISEDSEQINELSNEKLGQYKKAAGEQASKLDKAGEFDKAHKRFKGIIKATFKQFANDAKK